MVKQKLGFTLIEIIIGVAIVSIMMGIGLSSYAKAQDKQNMLKDARTVESLLKEAQKNATTGYIPSSGCTGHIEYYRIDFTSSTNVKMQVKCKSSALSDLSGKSYTLISPHVFTAYPDYIDFRTLNNGTDIAGGATSYQIIIRPTATSADRHGITVTRPGTIKYDGKI